MGIVKVGSYSNCLTTAPPSKFFEKLFFDKKQCKLKTEFSSLHGGGTNIPRQLFSFIECLGERVTIWLRRQLPKLKRGSKRPNL
jgi:hypothetical protein